jgi:hypothetical protein
MKKIIGLIIVLMLILTLSYAYDTDSETKKEDNILQNENYSILMPESYTFTEEEVYSNKEGYEISIVVRYLRDLSGASDEELKALSYDDFYSKEAIDIYKENIIGGMNSGVSEANEELKEEFSDKIDDDTFNMEFHPGTEAYLTTISNNSYPAIKADYSFGVLDRELYVVTYSIFDRTRLIILSVTGPDKAYINNDDIQKAINSFTIKNYSPFEKRTTWIATPNPADYSTNRDTYSTLTSSNDDNSFSIVSLVIAILLTLIIYMFVPILIKIFSRGGLDPDKARVVALINSVVIGGVDLFLAAANGGKWSIVPSIIYFGINSVFLTKNNHSYNDKGINYNNEKTDEEKYQDAVYTINHPSGIVPGLGDQNPISKPTEDVQLDSREIPWELQGDNAHNSDGKYEVPNASEADTSKSSNHSLEDIHNTIADIKKALNDDNNNMNQ